MLKIRRPLGRLIFNMGIAIPGKTVFLIETAPRGCQYGRVGGWRGVVVAGVERGSLPFRQLSKIFSQNYENFKLKLCTCALGTRTKFQLEILKINMISGIVYFHKVTLECSRNISETTPDHAHYICVKYECTVHQLDLWK